MRKFLPIKIHHQFYGYGWWFGKKFYFWDDLSGIVIVPCYAECNNTVYAYSGNKIGDGMVLSWDDDRSKERRRNKITKKYRIGSYFPNSYSTYKYRVEREKMFSWETVYITKTIEEAQEKLNEFINNELCLNH